MQKTSQNTNRLIEEKSPYLLQHAHNPVDWYPWGDEAFAKAKAEDKPIFLSIGYSTCHWCHVMEEESFEDQEVAEILNQNFIAIKVDREERPDIDSIYMDVCQRLRGSGGWPLTVVMTPEKNPFFAGTYFPKYAQRGRPGLIDILEKINHLWQTKRDRLENRGQEIITKLKQRQKNRSKSQISDSEMESVLKRSFNDFKVTFNQQYGGFGMAPKFPTPHNLMFLLRYYKAEGNDKALEMVEKTLDSMYQGGIYDHLGYGFSRYSTDEKWLVPHFEKMLYDNALLTIIYLEAYQLTDKKKYALIAEEISTYILRDMTSEAGGFYSAEDADSEGEEGKFYLWAKAEIEALLDDETAERFCKVYDITEQGNFAGKNIPNLITSNYDKQEVDAEFKTARKKLFKARKQRVAPKKDDKILTAWNGLMIVAMAKAGRILADKKYLNAAKDAVEFINQNLRREDGRLLARYRDGEANFLAYAADYAYLIWGLIELYQSSFEVEYLTLALELNDDLLKYFWDEENGGLYFYGSDSEELITRPKKVNDGALPSANSVAALNFLRLSKLAPEKNLAVKAEEQLKAFWSQIKNYPRSYAYFLVAVLFNQVENREIVLVGERNSEKTKKMIVDLNKRFLPFSNVILNDSRNRAELIKINPILKEQEQINQQPTAYICKDFSCQEPTTNLIDRVKNM